MTKLPSRFTVAAILLGLASPSLTQSQPTSFAQEMIMMGRGGGGGPSFGGGGGGPSFGGGGDRGGGWSRGGFGRGGFDPSAMLGRMDANGNGQLDPEEMQGPARMFLGRMAEGNPNIDLNKPIPLATITAEFEKMRGGGSFGGGFGGGGGGSWWGGSEGEDSAPEIRQLVRGFGDSKKPDLPPGFGPKAEVEAVKIEPRDVTEAEERIRRYDRNRDQMLDEEELRSGRWTDSPMQYDRNGDKKLTAEELAARYARRRLAGDTGNNGNSERGNQRGVFSLFGGGGGPSPSAGKEDASSEKEAPAKRSASFRAITETKKTTGIPSWFLDSDTNKDNQLTMVEFSGKIDDSKIEEFQRFDLNSDGMITSKEALTAVKNGILRTSVSTAKPSNAATNGSATSSSTGGAGFSREGVPADIAVSYVNHYETRMRKMDKNNNKIISSDEWSNDNGGTFDQVDTNQDGAISLAEFVIFKKKK